MEQDIPHDPYTSSTFLTHWPLVFLEGKVASFGVTFFPHYFPGAPSGIYSCRNTVQMAPFAEIFLFLSCLLVLPSCLAFSLFALACSIPTLPTGIAEEWKWGREQEGVVLAFCFETAQAEVHQQKHS